MRESTDKVAVITGAASGIGRALADRCAQEGLRVVLADIEEQALTKAKTELETTGARVLAVPTDVSQVGDIRALAEKTLDAFGSVHLLFNNAGVVVPGSIWETTEADWEWVIGVNLWGVIHGVRVFVPIMLEQDAECHIVNTASSAGLVSAPEWGSYRVSKHGIVALSETLHHELKEIGAKIAVSVLCPALVNTRIWNAARNRPADLQNGSCNGQYHPGLAARIEALRQHMQAAMPPSEVADCVIGGIRDKRFYILPHPEVREEVRTRMEDILQERNPTIQ